MKVKNSTTIFLCSCLLVCFVLFVFFSRFCQRILPVVLFLIFWDEKVKVWYAQSKGWLIVAAACVTIKKPTWDTVED